MGPSAWYQALGTKRLVPSALVPSTWYQVLGTIRVGGVVRGEAGGVGRRRGCSVTGIPAAGLAREQMRRTHILSYPSLYPPIHPYNRP